jgi:hypothetical protein
MNIRVKSYGQLRDHKTVCLEVNLGSRNSGFWSRLSININSLGPVSPHYLPNHNMERKYRNFNCGFDLNEPLYVKAAANMRLVILRKEYSWFSPYDWVYISCRIWAFMVVFCSNTFKTSQRDLPLFLRLQTWLSFNQLKTYALTKVTFSELNYVTWTASWSILKLTLIKSLATTSVGLSCSRALRQMLTTQDTFSGKDRVRDGVIDRRSLIYWHVSRF